MGQASQLWTRVRSSWSVGTSLGSHSPRGGRGLPWNTCHLLLHPFNSYEDCGEAALASGACCQLFSLFTALPKAASAEGRTAAWV